MSEWIKLEERTPESNTDVIVFIPRGKKRFEGIAYCAIDQIVEGIEFRSHVFDFGKITHWMPLPNPPDQTEDLREMVKEVK